MQNFEISKQKEDTIVNMFEDYIENMKIIINLNIIFYYIIKYLDTPQNY